MPLKVLERHESKDGPKCLLSLVDEVFDNDPLVQVSPIKEKNTFVSEGTPLLVIESARRLFTLRSPIEGLIKGFNRELFSMVDQFDFSKWVVSLEEMTIEKYQEWKKLNTEPTKVPKKVDNAWLDNPVFAAPPRGLILDDAFEQLRADQVAAIHNQIRLQNVVFPPNQIQINRGGRVDALPQAVVARPQPRQPARRNGPRPPNPYMRNG